MAIRCPSCGHEYDVTLFEFESGVVCDCGEYVSLYGESPAELPIDGQLDLHTFLPADVKDLVPDYLCACEDAGIRRVRIIHGKGDGTLLRTVHAILERTPRVDSFELAGPEEGGWGATIVHLKEPQFKS